MTDSINDEPISFEFLPGKEIPPQDIVIHSERLRMVPICQRFAQDVFREFTNRITRYMFPIPAQSLEDSLEFIDSCAVTLAERSEIVLAITSGSNGEFLGCVGLHWRKSVETPDFGIWLKESAHGKRLGLEAIEALKSWADQNLRVKSYRYPVDRANIPSRKIPEALGGVIVEEVRAPTMDPDKYLDEIIFEIAAQ